VKVGVIVGVRDGVRVSVGVKVGVRDGVTEAVDVGVGVGVKVREGTAVAVSVGGNGVWVAVNEGMGVEVCCDWPRQPARMSASSIHAVKSLGMG